MARGSGRRIGLWGSSDPILTMMQPAESLMRKDATRSYATNSAFRCSLPESKMVCGPHDNSRPNQKAAAAAGCHSKRSRDRAGLGGSSRPSAPNSVLPGTLNRSANTLDSHRSNRGRSLRAVLGISINDRKPGSEFITKLFPQLLDNRQARRMWCDVKEQDATAIVAAGIRYGMPHLFDG